jgi:predicted transcriptional regulator
MMRKFLRRLFAPAPVMRVSVVMHPEIYARLDRLARRTDHAGDAILNTAVRAWLDENEAALLAGDWILQEADEC